MRLFSLLISLLTCVFIITQSAYHGPQPEAPQSWLAAVSFVEAISQTDNEIADVELSAHVVCWQIGLHAFSKQRTASFYTYPLIMSRNLFSSSIRAPPTSSN